jgi:gamma-glutamylcyclotransferase (GGCT)/AIG2-like uncharacterized protein YtfP
MTNNLLFVYGSLLNTGNEFAGYLSNNSIVLSTGSFKGRLYDIGEYPGALADNKSHYNITGTIVKLNNPTDNLKILDDYEGFGADQAAPNLFIRKLLPVETAKGPVNCWVYLYNLFINGFHEIISGDYLAYLIQKQSHKKSDG